MQTPPPYGQTLETVAAGRAETVAQLRALAAALEVLPLDDLRRQATVALERAPAES